ncbi:hypothetical protein, variant 2 [Phialophora macrospora]|nr:hypothetical protein, variant 1 [Phialophora macrospora]KIW70801.1 hypothetical protein, variant 2 [Phialophora macrospora]
MHFQSSNRVHLKQRIPDQTLLDEDVFSALLDVGFRTSICPKPIRPGAGVQCLMDQDGYHLCDVAPTTFALNYLQRLKEQSQFIPGISRLLQNFVTLASSSKSGSDPSYQGPYSNGIPGQGPEGLQTHLWHLLRNGVRNHESSRRLHPLKWSDRVRVSDSMLIFPHVFSRSSHVEPQDEACLQSESGSCEAIGEDDLLDFHLDLDHQANIPWNAIPVVTAAAVKGGDRLPREGLHDGNGVQRVVEIYGFPFEGEAATSPLQHESRKYSKSVSQMSDVSMLLPCERPMKDGRIIGQPQAIGGTSWLTQNVIRMHPLRQQQHQHDEVDLQRSARKRHSLYERPDLGWWSDTSDASDLPLEEEQYRNSHLDDACLISLCPSEKARVHDCLDLQHDPGEERLPASVSPMSTRQTREGSSGSLAEVIGNDHLLWHMWKRRASVAPRGEEDITDMKTLFATDPDMKLFSSRWDLDPSDLSSSSNEDPMLQETTYNQSPRDKANSPMTPNSERRSYFGPPRSPSSSGYVGRSSADPKRRSSLIKRFTWGGRQNTPQAPGLDGSKLDQRAMEVKRRKTMDDYEMMDREASNDDSGDMLF